MTNSKLPEANQLKKLLIKIYDLQIVMVRWFFKRGGQTNLNSLHADFVGMPDCRLSLAFPE